MVGWITLEYPFLPDISQHSMQVAYNDSSKEHSNAISYKDSFVFNSRYRTDVERTSICK
jgi:hypothetical protein